jgi:NADH-quinone oxidoreductase subunit K
MSHELINSLYHVGLNHYLVLSSIIFALGVLGVLMRRNAIIILMSIELMLNAANLAFIAFSKFTGNLDGQIIVFFVMTIAAAEASIGLALIVAIYKRFKEVDISMFENLKG